jgi:hypothetical protein
MYLRADSSLTPLRHKKMLKRHMQYSEACCRICRPSTVLCTQYFQRGIAICIDEFFDESLYYGGILLVGLMVRNRRYLFSMLFASTIFCRQLPCLLVFPSQGQLDKRSNSSPIDTRDQSRLEASYHLLEVT